MVSSRFGHLEVFWDPVENSNRSVRYALLYSTDPTALEIQPEDLLQNRSNATLLVFDDVTNVDLQERATEDALFLRAVAFLPDGCMSQNDEVAKIVVAPADPVLSNISLVEAVPTPG